MIKMKIHTKIILFLALALSFGVFGQVVPPPVPPPPPPGLPIDGGVIFLIISGAIYGILKLKK